MNEKPVIKAWESWMETTGIWTGSLGNGHDAGANYSERHVVKEVNEFQE